MDGREEWSYMGTPSSTMPATLHDITSIGISMDIHSMVRVRLLEALLCK